MMAKPMKTLELHYPTSQFLMIQDILILSTRLIMWIGHRKQIRKLTFRRSEGIHHLLNYTFFSQREQLHSSITISKPTTFAYRQQQKLSPMAIYLTLCCLPTNEATLHWMQTQDQSTYEGTLASHGSSVQLLCSGCIFILIKQIGFRILFTLDPQMCQKGRSFKRYNWRRFHG